MAEPARLPVIVINGKSYFYDIRLKQLRNTSDPHDYVNLDSVQIFVANWVCNRIKCKRKLSWGMLPELYGWL